MSTSQNMALCCQCGTLRSVTATLAGRATYEDHPDGRCLVVLKCATCKAMTQHAAMLNGDRRDDAEKIDRRRDKWRARLTSRLDRLEAAGWEVVWHEPGTVGASPQMMARISQWWNGPILCTRLRLATDAEPEDLWDCVRGFEHWVDYVYSGSHSGAWRISPEGARWRGSSYDYPTTKRTARALEDEM